MLTSKGKFTAACGAQFRVARTTCLSGCASAQEAASSFRRPEVDGYQDFRSWYSFDPTHERFFQRFENTEHAVAPHFVNYNSTISAGFMAACALLLRWKLAWPITSGLWKKLSHSWINEIGWLFKHHLGAYIFLRGPVRSDKPASRTLRPLVWAHYFAFWLAGNLLRNREAPPSLVQTDTLPKFPPSLPRPG